MIVVQRAARLADVERLVPLGDRLEIRPDQPLDVVGDRRPAAPSASSTTNPARQVERAPDPERDREPVAALDRPVARAQQAERRPRPGGQHQVARERHPVPARAARTASRSVIPGRSPSSRRRTPFEVWQAAHSSAASCSTSLTHAQPVGGVDEQVRRRSRRGPSRPVRRRSSSTMNAGTSMVDRSAYVFQPTTPTRLPGPMPSSARISASGRERSRGWPGRLRSWNRTRRIGSGAAPAIPKHSLPTRIAGSPSHRARRRGAPPRSAGRSRSARRGWRCARDRRRRRAGRSRGRRHRARRRVEPRRVQRGRDARAPGRASRSRAARSRARRAVRRSVVTCASWLERRPRARPGRIAVDAARTGPPSTSMPGTDRRRRAT